MRDSPTNLHGGFAGVLRAILVGMAVWVVAAPVSAQQSHVVPGDYESAGGPGGFLGPFANTARTYQLLIHETLLSDLLGQDIIGITWRLPGTAASSWPAADVNYADFEVRLSGSVDPALRSVTFADNIVGPQTLVRDGPLNITTGAFTAIGTPRPFGPAIDVDPWLYEGGHLLIELRHGVSDGTNQSVDALITSTAGYGTLFSAVWTGNQTGTSGSQGNFAVTQLITAVPEPATLAAAAVGVGFLVVLRRLRRRVGTEP